VAKSETALGRIYRGTKRSKSSKEAESQKVPRSKEGKSSSSSNDISRSHHKSSGKSAHAEEPSHTVDDSRVQKNQEFDTGNNDEQPNDEAAPKNDWFKKLERPLTLDPNWNKRQQVDFRPPQTWISVIARAEKPPTSFDELTDTPIHFSAFVMNQLNITNLNQELLDYFINNDLEYLKGGSLNRQCSTSVTKTNAATYEIKWIKDMVPYLWNTVKVVSNVYDSTDLQETRSQRRMSTPKNEFIAVTRLRIMKKYDRGHLDEIKVRREDQQLYMVKEDQRYDLNVALGMFTRRIVIQRWVEDLKLDPQRVIYKEDNNKNRLMHTDELYKFSDGTLNDVRTTLHDITSGIRMEYLPKRKWSGLDKQRARVMIYNIDKLLFEKRLLRNLEKFFGGREYGNDLRLLEWTI
nr:hypothetical protein [Tanacetum cinerariifolium]